MKKDKSSISKSTSYEKIGEFWDSHDLTNFDKQTHKVNFDVDIRNDKTYCVLDKKISNQLESLANERGVSPDILVNLLLQEKLRTLNPKKKAS